MWGSITDGFCEGKGGGGYPDGLPEYWSVVSSAYMVLLGLWGLAFTENHSLMLRVVISLVMVSGLGSIMLHSTWQRGWGYMDGMPMLIAANLGAMQAWDIILF